MSRSQQLSIHRDAPGTGTGSSTSVFAWIQSQSDEFLNNLYGGPGDRDHATAVLLESPGDQCLFACKAIFQSFSILSKNIVMRLLFVSPEAHAGGIDSSISTVEASRWFKNALEFQECLRELRAYRVIEDYAIDGTLQLNEHFRQTLQFAIMQPTEPWSSTLSTSGQRDPVNDVRALGHDIDGGSLDRWNLILKAIMNLASEGDISTLSSPVIKLLRHELELIPKVATRVAMSSSRNASLTGAGYNFMLKDYKTQIWELTWQMVLGCARREEALSFLFMLSYCKVGKGYPSAQLTSTQQNILRQLCDIGVIYAHSTAFPGTFFPTRAAVNLIFKSEGFGDPSDPMQSVNGANKQSNQQSAGIISPSGYTLDQADIKVIVETNMQVLAYVTNDLHLALLRMFVDINMRMPNMVVGFLTREKAFSAFSSGITVVQVIEFLSSHAHPSVLVGGGPPVPDHVADMLTLWHHDYLKQSKEDEIMARIAATQGY